MKKIMLIFIVLISCKLEIKDFKEKEVEVKLNQTNQKDSIKIIKLLLFESEKLMSDNKISEARRKINKAIKLSKEFDNDIETANSLFLLSKLEYKYGIPEIAELSFEKAKEIYISKKVKMKIIELNTFGLKLYKKLGKKDKVNEIINNPLSQ